MLFWTIAIAVTALACAALYYASLRRGVNARDEDPEAARTEHQRRRLAEIEEALAQQRLAAPEATAAKAELAREVLRQQLESAAVSPHNGARATSVLPFSLVAVAIIAFASYGLLGNPSVESMPLESRPEVLAMRQIQDQVLQVEQYLAQRPDDLRGWSVLVPIYMRLGRFDDAVTALRHVNELQTPTATTKSDLAEALYYANGGVLTAEARSLLESAIELEPSNFRPHAILADAAMRAGDYVTAEAKFQHLLDIGIGNEPWYEGARAGLAAARDGLRQSGAEAVLALPDNEQSELIRGMVESLSERLLREGGSLDEWERLVRSRLVLGQVELAQEAYAAARVAYPDAQARAALDALASQGGLN